MSEWITDRSPTEEDAIDGNVLIWCEYPAPYCNKVEIDRWSEVSLGMPWAPIIAPEPYIKPKRWRVTTATGGYLVYDSSTSSEVADSIPTREAAERIAAIYEEVMP